MNNPRYHTDLRYLKHMSNYKKPLVKNDFDKLQDIDNQLVSYISLYKQILKNRKIDISFNTRDKVLKTIVDKYLEPESRVVLDKVELLSETNTGNFKYVLSYTIKNILSDMVVTPEQKAYFDEYKSDILKIVYELDNNNSNNIDNVTFLNFIYYFRDKIFTDYNIKRIYKLNYNYLNSKSINRTKTLDEIFNI